MTTETGRDPELPQLLNWGDDKWRKKAACIGADIDFFFPEKTSPLTNFQIASAKAICLRCTVKVECLKFAVENGITNGTYGGVSPKDRRTLTVDAITEDTVKLRLKKAYRYLKTALDEAPFATLARLMGESEEWVKEQVERDADICI